MKRRILVPSVLYAAAMYGFILLPVVSLVIFSFQGSRVPVPPLQDPTIGWYLDVLADRRLAGALANSAIVAVVSSAVAVALGFLAAYARARHFPGRGQSLWLVITLPMLINYLVIGMGLSLLFNAVDVSKSLWTIGIGHVTINMPFCFLIAGSQIDSRFLQAERAAHDLGASGVQTFLLVTLPMAWPALAVSFLLSMTFSWDEFIVSFLLSRFDVTLPVEIWSLTRSGISAKLNAVGSIVFLVSAVSTLVAASFLARGGRR